MQFSFLHVMCPKVEGAHAKYVCRMRSAVEKQLDLIAQGQAEQKAVLEHALRIFTGKFAYFMRKIQYMDELFEATFSKLSETGRPLRYTCVWE
jgi:DNA topoisomerase IA